MAFYRITIWLEDGQILQAIRELNSSDIDYATKFFKSELSQIYGDIKDIEAAMLSTHCTAVKRFIAERELKKEARKFNQEIRIPPAGTKKEPGATTYFSSRKMNFPPE